MNMTCILLLATLLSAASFASVNVSSSPAEGTSSKAQIQIKYTSRDAYDMLLEDAGYLELQKEKTREIRRGNAELSDYDKLKALEAQVGNMVSLLFEKYKPTEGGSSLQDFEKFFVAERQILKPPVNKQIVTEEDCHEYIKVWLEFEIRQFDLNVDHIRKLKECEKFLQEQLTAIAPQTTLEGIMQKFSEYKEKQKKEVK